MEFISDYLALPQVVFLLEHWKELLAFYAVGFFLFWVSSRRRA